MEPKIYFNTESPDFNFGLWGDLKKIVANRTVLCILTEYGLCNNRRMMPHEYNAFIESLQMITGGFAEIKSRVRLKRVRLKRVRLKRVRLKALYSKRRSATKPIKTIAPATLSEHTSESIPIEDTS